MPKWLVFFLGVATGVVVIFGIMFVMGLNSQNNRGIWGATFFDKPGVVIHEKSFKVVQVIENTSALAYGKENSGSYLGTLYLLHNNLNDYYYDDQILNVPKDCVVKQVGIYKYTSRMGVEKTVPIVSIYSK